MKDNSSYLMAIDQGTTSSRVCLFTQDGRLVRQAQEEFRQIFPKPGWVEHDPQDIWRSTLNSIKKTCEGFDVHKIAALGITNQRETCLAWDSSTGKSFGHAIVWQCKRTQEDCEKLRSPRLSKKLSQKTGLVLDPYFSATKWSWMFKNNSELQRAKKKHPQDIRLGTIDVFLLWNLTGGKSFATDVSNASRTLLLNINDLKWDHELLELFEVPGESLPEVLPSNALFGKTHGLGVLPDGTPIFGMIGDQQAALFGQGAFAAGEAKCTFGTGSFILLNTGPKKISSKSKLLTTLAWQIKGQKPTYALEGGAFICGAAVQWLRDGLGILQKSSEIEDLAREVESSAGVEFVPALSGLGPPYWVPEARGLITGLTRGSNKNHLAYATLEAMALQNVEILEAMAKDLGRKIKSIKVDGGAARNSLLMQMQSDYSQGSVFRPQVFETTALGAALMAGLGVGLYSDLQEVKEKWRLDEVFTPRLSKKKRDERLTRWQKAVRMTWNAKRNF